ncbi:MAG: YwaF family protein [Candidatus Izemoplasmatales bacterium]|nr:YwaF family protein [Candidatus Izemoplasmatales bacterium]
MFLASFFTSAGMDDNPTGYLFTWRHFLYIGFAILAFWLLMKLLLKQSEKTKRTAVIVLGILMLLLKYGGEILVVWEWNRFGDSISSFSHPFWDVRTFISFQICGINNVLLPLVIWFNIKPMKDFLYTTSIMGGLAVILYPVGILYGDPFVLTFPIIRSLIVHFLLVFLPCFMIATGDFQLEKKRWKNTFFGALIVSAFAMLGNLFIDPDANNLYLMKNPFLGGPIPLLNSLPNGVHVIFLLVMVFLAFLMEYWLIGKYQRFQHRNNFLADAKEKT